MQFFQTKFQKSFVLSTKKRIKCFPWKNPVDSRWKSGDITRTIEAANIAPLALTVLWVRVNCCRIRLRLKYTIGKTSFFCSMEVLKSFNWSFLIPFKYKGLQLGLWKCQAILLGFNGTGGHTRASQRRDRRIWYLISFPFYHLSRLSNRANKIANFK